ncbi:MAG: hypothetical protein IID38_06060, partial [Planctomycetes bacterium]|nr:hypothetical protein [Planctomycetota bacterium]
YSCASITFPLIAQYVLVGCKPHPHRRLFTKLDEMTQKLRRSACDNEALLQQYEGVVDLPGKARGRS